MHKLPVVRNRQSRASAPPQVFGFERSLIMALVGRRDGRNFGYGRQLSYAGPKALRVFLAEDITPQSRRTVIAGRRSSAGVVRRMGPDLMMRGRLIDRPCWTTQGICANKSNKALSVSLPRKTGCPA